MISAIQGASAISWARAQLHLSRRTAESKAQIIPTPRLLSKAISVLGLLLFFSYGVSLLDTWLHLSTSAAFFISTSPYPVNARTDFGKQINKTLCEDMTDFTTPYDDSTPATYGNVCGLFIGGQLQYTVSAPEGIRTLSNSSVLNKVAFANDATAIVAPAYLPTSQNVTYTASTVGVSSVCQR